MYESPLAPQGESLFILHPALAGEPRSGSGCPASCGQHAGGGWLHHHLSPYSGLTGRVNSQRVSTTLRRGKSEEVVEKGSTSPPNLRNTKEGKLRRRVIVPRAVPSHVFLGVCLTPELIHQSLVSLSPSAKRGVLGGKCGLARESREGICFSSILSKCFSC